MLRPFRPGILVIPLAGLLVARVGVQAPAPNTPALTTRNLLLKDAREAIAHVPPPIAATDLAELAQEEHGPNLPLSGSTISVPPSTDDILRDWSIAFHAAADLRPELSDSDTVVSTLHNVKQRVEQQAVNGVIAVHEFDSALSLARAADIPHAPLYDLLIRAGMSQFATNCANQITAGATIALGGRVAPNYRPPASMAECLQNLAEGRAANGRAGRVGPAGRAGGRAEQPPLIPPSTAGYDPLSLARECFASDGTFPYSALWSAYLGISVDSADAEALVREILTRAGDDPNPTREEITTLLAIHSVAPKYDPQLVDIVVSDLQRLQLEMQNLPPNRGSGLLLQSGKLLLSLLGQLDANRENEMLAQMPAFAPGPAASTPPAPSGPVGPPQPPDPVAMLSSANAMPIGTDQETLEKIQRLGAAAAQLLRNSPDLARQTALSADALVTDSLIASSDAQILQLSNIEQRVGLESQSGALLERCLDSIENADVAFDKAWPSLTPEQQASYYTGAGQLSGQTRAVYQIAARIDYDLAAGRARDSHAVILKPIILLAVAGAQPAQNVVVVQYC